MYQQTHISNEKLVEKAFSSQSFIFDNKYGHDTMILYKRLRVRKHLETFLLPGSRMLELNAGTGEDAIYFAGKGHVIHATDIAEGMLKELAGKSAGKDKISYELCSYLSLDQLINKGPYDCVFSNFAGLNCTGELDKVLRSFSPLLKPGGIVTLVVLPRFCLWETLLLFKGKFRTAFRRVFAKKGAAAFVEGNPFTCWYYNPSYIVDCLGDSFKVLGIEGLCTFVPPSYIAGFADRYPRFFHLLSRVEEKCKTKWPWNLIGDYYMITLRKQ